VFEFLSFKRKPIDPMTDLHSVTQWMKELPLGDMYAANEKVVKTLRDYNDQNIPATKDRLAALFHLDEGAQEILRALQNQYLLNPRMSRSIERRLWNAVFGYYQEILHAYHGHIMEYVGDPNGSKIAASIPLITARTINYFALDAKWCYFRYERVNPKLWKRIHNLYHFAEYEEFERRPLKLYEETDSNGTTVADLYLRALMLDVVNNGSLLPRQIDLVDRWLASFTRYIVVETEFKPTRHTYFVDLTETRGACRVRRVEPSETKRYWDTVELQSQLDRVKQELVKGETPAKLGLTEDCKPPTCIELLEKVATLWAPTVKRVQRASERKRVMQQIDVVRGMSQICTNVRLDNERANSGSGAQEAAGGLSYEEMLDVHIYGFVTKRTQAKLGQGREEKGVAPVVTHERWVMENESEKGYGATINAQSDDWVRLGKLVGLKPERRGHWNVAVIRRMTHVSPTQIYVGMEVLADAPVALMLRASHHQPTGYTIDGVDAVDVVLPKPCLYIHGDKEMGQPETLLIESAEYASGRELWFNAKGTAYNLRLKEVIERGDDWLRVGFQVLSRQALAEQMRV
jgi:hypothetical protein